MKVERICKYHFIDTETGEIVKTLSQKQIFKEFGIKNIKPLIGEYSCPVVMGYLVIEGYPADEHFSRLKDMDSEEFEYYISNLGYVLQVEKENRIRKKLEGILDQEHNELITYTDEGKVIRNAYSVISNFTDKLPRNFYIEYKDEDILNCDQSNLSVKPKMY